MQINKAVITDCLLWGIREAFLAGNESPYDLKKQEVNRIYDLMIDRLSSTSILVKNSSSASEVLKNRSSEPSDGKIALGVCSLCGAEDSFIEHRYNLPTGEITSALLCRICKRRK